MKVEKKDAVAICQDYGLATADGWDDAKLFKKLGEVLRLFRSGEYDWTDKKLLPIVEGLAEVKEFELVGENIKGRSPAEKEEEKEDSEDGEDDWDIDDEADDVMEDEEEDKEEDDPENCPLQGGERVIVHDPEEDWKGIVDRPISNVYVYVKDREGNECEVSVEHCEVVKNGSKPKPKEEDDDEQKIRKLKEQIAKEKAKGKKGKSRGKKLRRDQMFVQVMRDDGESGTVEQIGELLEVDYVEQGRSSNLKASVNTAKRLLKAGVVFGVIEQKGDKFRWTR